MNRRTFERRASEGVPGGQRAQCGNALSAAARPQGNPVSTNVDSLFQRVDRSLVLYAAGAALVSVAGSIVMLWIVLAIPIVGLVLGVLELVYGWRLRRAGSKGSTLRPFSWWMVSLGAAAALLGCLLAVSQGLGHFCEQRCANTDNPASLAFQTSLQVALGPSRSGERGSQCRLKG